MNRAHPLRTGARGVLGAFFVALGALNAGTADAQAPRLVLVQTDEELRSDALRIEAELELAGFSVRRIPLTDGAAEEAPEPPAVAVVRLRASSEGVQLTVFDAITDKITTRVVDRGPDVALRVVELLHASLLEVRARHFEARTTTEAQRVTAASVAEEFVDARMAAPSVATQTSLAVGIALLIHEPDPLFGASLGLLHVRKHLLISAEVRTSFTALSLEDRRGGVNVRLGMALVGVGAELHLGAFRFGLLAAAGPAMIAADVDAAERYQSRGGIAFSAYLEGRLLIRYERPFGWFGVQVAGGSLVPRIQLSVQNEPDFAEFRGPLSRLELLLALRLGG
ncbi:MAG: hypothetical protein AAF411_22385 [Myxococcota bacterium]